MSNRKAFEKWAKDKGYSLDFLKHSTGGAYLDSRMQAAWQQWNADPYPDKDPWEAYELVCKRNRELEEVLQEALTANQFNSHGWVHRANQLLGNLETP